MTTTPKSLLPARARPAVWRCAPLAFLIAAGACSSSDEPAPPAPPPRAVENTPPVGPTPPRPEPAPDEVSRDEFGFPLVLHYDLPPVPDEIARPAPSALPP